ncbi:uncharacterized protein LOC122404974 [Colletes gigas]|uniref:uncharacterized protein LOC122404974 n=1 Tax=Colletes gigas TaxID=935657 RepID=UPI001C9A89EC|nr:uncharacterized protein LOC122404974 [Colletes gigas]
MSLIVMFNLRGLTPFIWIVSVLTLSISDEVKTDGIASLTSVSNATFANASLEDDHRTLSSAIQPTSETIYSTKISNENVTPSFAGEGGPILIASTTQRASSTTFQSASISDTLNVGNNLSNEKDYSPNVTRKNSTLSKIVPRKGANEMLHGKKEQSSFIETQLPNDGEVVKYNVTGNTIKMNNTMLNVTNERLKNVTHTTVNGTLQQNTNTSQQNTSTLQQNVSASTVSTIISLLKEHKAKPTVTVAGPNGDKRPFVSPTRSRLGMPKKIDYLLPVIITLLALPILGAVMFMVYKQGRDCWDKRHYRRMDFLIDGMYND